MLRTQILLDGDARCVGYEQTIHVIPCRVTMYRKRQKKLESVTEMGTSSNSFWTACRFHQICIIILFHVYFSLHDINWRTMIYKIYNCHAFFVYFQLLEGLYINRSGPRLFDKGRPPRHCSWPLTSCTSEGTFWNNAFWFSGFPRWNGKMYYEMLLGCNVVVCIVLIMLLFVILWLCHMFYTFSLCDVHNGPVFQAQTWQNEELVLFLALIVAILLRHRTRLTRSLRYNSRTVVMLGLVVLQYDKG